LDASKGVYLGGTLLSILLSLYLFTSGRRETAIFVGLWAPTVVNLGQPFWRKTKPRPSRTLGATRRVLYDSLPKGPAGAARSVPAFLLCLLAAVFSRE
jgi:hypothetical protein